MIGPDLPGLDRMDPVASPLPICHPECYSLTICDCGEMDITAASGAAVPGSNPGSRTFDNQTTERF